MRVPNNALHSQAHPLVAHIDAGSGGERPGARQMMAWAAPALPLAALALPFYMLAPAIYAARDGFSV